MKKKVIKRTFTVFALRQLTQIGTFLFAEKDMNIGTFSLLGYRKKNILLSDGR